MTCEVVAHRGSPRELHENTLESFARALEHGADAIELDVHGTRDGVVVVHHDPVIRSRAEPATRADAPAPPRALSQMEIADVREVTLPGGLRIPTLDEVLDLVGTRAKVYVEIKGRGIERPVIEAIRRHPARCAVHSFDHRAVRTAKELLPDLRTGVLLASYVIDSVAVMRAAGALDLWQHCEYVDAALVRTVHAAGGRVIAWTVNGWAVARELADAGVDGICTDVTPTVREALGLVPVSDAGQGVPL